MMQRKYMVRSEFRKLSDSELEKVYDLTLGFGAVKTEAFMLLHEIARQVMVERGLQLDPMNYDP